MNTKRRHERRPLNNVRRRRQRKWPAEPALEARKREEWTSVGMGNGKGGLERGFSRKTCTKDRTETR